MSVTSHGRRSWKDSPTAKAIAETISLLLITGLMAVLGGRSDGIGFEDDSGGNC